MDESHPALLSAAVECFDHVRRLSIPDGLWFCARGARAGDFSAWVLPPFALDSRFRITANGLACDRDGVGDVPGWIQCVYERFGMKNAARNYVCEFSAPARTGLDELTLACEFAGRAASLFSSFFWSERPQPSTPAFNMRRVTRSDDSTSFSLMGYTQYRHIRTLIARHAPAARSVLDWGCGAGRILRLFLDDSHVALTGADVDRHNVDWCRDTYGERATFVLINPLAPSPLGDASFDVIYGISVFTHLSLESERFWLDELARLLKPQGLAVMTVHGAPSFFTSVNDFWKYAALAREGFLDVGACPDLQVDGEDTIAPELYRSVFHSRTHIESVWGRRFRIVDYIAGAAPAHQDYVVMTTR